MGATAHKLFDGIKQPDQPGTPEKKKKKETQLAE